MIQIEVIAIQNQGKANEYLRGYQLKYPKRKIINVNMTPIEWPGGWFMTIVYEIENK